MIPLATSWISSWFIEFAELIHWIFHWLYWIVYPAKGSDEKINFSTTSGNEFVVRHGVFLVTLLHKYFVTIHSIQQKSFWEIGLVWFILYCIYTEDRRENPFSNLKPMPCDLKPSSLISELWLDSFHSLFFSKSIISVHFSPALVAKVNTELDMEHNHWKLTDDYKWWCADISLETLSNPRNPVYG